MEPKTRFELAIDAEARNIKSIYGISELTAKIILLKGVITYHNNLSG